MYDREEWRRPWRTDDTPAPVGVRTEPAPSDAPPSAATWAQPGVTEEPTATSGDGPISRYPQPPPSAWDERSAGPGSPAGSVRPPDTTGTVDAPSRERRGPRLWAVALVAVLSAALGAGATVVAMTAGELGTGGGGSVSAPSIEIDGDITNVVPAVAQAVTPSVVSIDVRGGPAGGQLGGPPALGSGVIYRSDGYILTNHHVVEGADQVRVRLASGDLLDGTVIGSDELNDLAVIEVEAEDLPAVNVRDGDDPLVVGETVVAIGSPFGLDGSVTAGVISALNREIVVDEEDGAALTIPSVVQTDAAINPGNSGGALVDARGELVGINTAILTRTGASQGVGFAVPADQAILSADEIIEHGFVRHALLGVRGEDVTPEIAEEFGLDITRGAIVESVQDGSSADEAGIASGDIVVEVDAEPLATMSELVAEVRGRQPGDEMELTVVRDGERLTVTVTLGERPR